MQCALFLWNDILGKFELFFFLSCVGVAVTLQLAKGRLPHDTYCVGNRCQAPFNLPAAAMVCYSSTYRRDRRRGLKG